jgi:hypothetical protein
VKDITNELNKFEGVWKYTNDGVEFSLFLNKRVHYLIAEDNIYIDMLVGEYIYKVDGIEVLNTTTNSNNPDFFGNNIAGISFINKGYFPVCEKCISGERRLTLHFKDPTVDNIFAEINLRHVVENGVEKLEAVLYETVGITEEGDPEHIKVPSGNYIFIKQ